jgi:hypothetical protein
MHNREYSRMINLRFVFEIKCAGNYEEKQKNLLKNIIKS